MVASGGGRVGDERDARCQTKLAHMFEHWFPDSFWLRYPENFGGEQRSSRIEEMKWLAGRGCAFPF